MTKEQELVGEQLYFDRAHEWREHMDRRALSRVIPHTGPMAHTSSLWERLDITALQASLCAALGSPVEDDHPAMRTLYHDFDETLKSTIGLQLDNVDIDEFYAELLDERDIIETLATKPSEWVVSFTTDSPASSTWGLSTFAVSDTRFLYQAPVPLDEAAGTFFASWVPQLDERMFQTAFITSYAEQMDEGIGRYEPLQGSAIEINPDWVSVNLLLEAMDAGLRSFPDRWGFVIERVTMLQTASPASLAKHFSIAEDEILDVRRRPAGDLIARSRTDALQRHERKALIALYLSTVL